MPGAYTLEHRPDAPRQSVVHSDVSDETTVPSARERNRYGRRFASATEVGHLNAVRAYGLGRLVAQRADHPERTSEPAGRDPGDHRSATGRANERTRLQLLTRPGQRFERVKDEIVESFSGADDVEHSATLS